MKIKTMWRVLAFSAVFGLGLIGCGGDGNPSGGDNYNGGDNNTGGNNTGGGASGTVMLGRLKWMTTNLNVETADSWCYGEGGQVYVDGDGYVTLTPSQIQANCAKYGRLYTWEAAKSACQSVGMRLPSRGEWAGLVTAVGGTSTSTAGKKLKSTSGWNNNGNGTNDYGFSALPGGYRYSSGDFYGVGLVGMWWTATEYPSSNAYTRGMDSDSDFASEYDYYYKIEAFSARCVQE
ncbi:MAG: hypothetical protein LBC59_01510 [Chitinispirillales bacterium]|nr:hypothetical protein [Chitinispirillales bacterium]